MGFMMLGESVTGFPSDFMWRYGVMFFGDPESRRATPISGFVTREHAFIETVMHKWWKVLEKACERRGQLWDARIYCDNEMDWQDVITRVCDVIHPDRSKSGEDGVGGA